jgi:hypothetical protein
MRHSYFWICGWPVVAKLIDGRAVVAPTRPSDQRGEGGVAMVEAIIREDDAIGLESWPNRPCPDSRFTITKFVAIETRRVRHIIASILMRGRF